MEKTVLKEDFCDLIYSVLSNYVKHAWCRSASPRVNSANTEAAINNVGIILAHLASELHDNEVTDSFLRSYRLSTTYRENTIMEMLASMVYLTKSDFINAISSMKRARRRCNRELSMRYYPYQRLTEQFCVFLGNERNLR